MNFRQGRKQAQHPEHRAKRAKTMRAHRRAIQDWDPSRLPEWLTRDVYVLNKFNLRRQWRYEVANTFRAMREASRNYWHIQAGKRIPHPRHWQVLAVLFEFRRGLWTGLARGSLV